MNTLIQQKILNYDMNTTVNMTSTQLVVSIGLIFVGIAVIGYLLKTRKQH